MTRSMLCLAACLLVTMLVPARANAQATTKDKAVRDGHLGMVHTVLINDTDQRQKWFEYQAVNGRSYCAEVGSGAETSGALGAQYADPIVRIYADDGTTLITWDDNTLSEPDSIRGARACFTAEFTGSFYVQLTTFFTGTYIYRMRVVETTLWASWFFIGGDYNSFVLLRNTTSTTVNYTITWRSPAGTQIGQTGGTVFGNRALGINARSWVTNPAVNFNGTVEIAHDGSPQALVGQVTSLSASTGLGYDATLFQRQPW